MPELPDLEVVREFLGRVLPGEVVARAEIRRPIVVRDLVSEAPGAALVGRAVSGVGRWGKYLWLELGPRLWVTVNPKLAGRLAWCPGVRRAQARPAFVLSFCSGRELQYLDPKDMGQVYITNRLDDVPGLAEQGPDALDPALTLDSFAARLRPFRGEIKGVLTRQEAVAGIGNAYADEILHRAGISPFRKRTRLSDAEMSKLYAAVRAVLAEAIEVLRERVGERIDVEVRDHLQVHGRGGQPCPRCGRTISELHARQRITSFCRGCQPGTLVRN
ncbi:MAG: DNA-formamidopyrimidine glycosylase family protein [Anaerolineae bacterium]|nr:DNA-formamidopyrimidine glycosylase family protein [Anaerolineae bacterium]